MGDYTRRKTITKIQRKIQTSRDKYKTQDNNIKLDKTSRDKYRDNEKDKNKDNHDDNENDKDRHKEKHQKKTKKDTETDTIQHTNKANAKT